MIKFITREVISSLISIFIFLFVMFYAINILIPGDFLTPLRLMMSQEELDTLRDSLGANDPLYQRYFRWILSVFSGEISPGGFMQRNGKDILSTIFPTLNILIPSFLLSFNISKIPVLKTKIKKLYKNKIISDTFSTFLISIFPPITLFVIGGKFENAFQALFTKYNIHKPTKNLIEYSDFQFNLTIFVILLTIILFFTVIIDLFLLVKFNKYKFITLIFLILYLSFIDEILLNDAIIQSQDGFLTISIMSTFFIGEFILMNNVIVQNISREPHILTARALGYSNSKIFSNHIIRNTFGPFATRLGLSLPFTIASLVIVESTTNWRGMGSLLYQTIMNQDSNAAMGIFLLLAILTIFIRISISIFQAFVDPRIRLK
jgi:ABC-type dipeptide/oligopeptide/nickel transport system permease component